MKNFETITKNELVNYIINNDFDSIKVNDLQDSEYLKLYIEKYEEKGYNFTTIQILYPGKIYNLTSTIYLVDTDHDKVNELIDLYDEDIRIYNQENVEKIINGTIEDL